MDRQNIVTLMFEHDSDEHENIIQIIEDFQDLFEDNLLEAEIKTLHVRNENYYEITIPQYSLSDFHAHFRMTRRTMEVSKNNYDFTLTYSECSFCILITEQ